MAKEGIGVTTKEVGTARAMVRGFGAHEASLDANWMALAGINIGNWLAELGKKFGFDLEEFHALLMQAGVSFDQLLAGQIEALQGAKIEADTAAEARIAFGQPEAPLPMILDVYMRLAEIEANALQDLQSKAEAVEEWWLRFEVGMRRLIGMAVAVELVKIEEEEEGYKESKQNATEIAEERAILVEAKEFVDDESSERIKSAKTQKERLLQILNELGYAVFNPLNAVFEKTIFQASHKPVQLTAV